MPGMMTIRPGPLTFQKRPSMNTTPRSYSRRMRKAENSSMAMTIRTKPDEINSILTFLLVIRLNLQYQSIDSDDLDLLPARERHARTRLPFFAVHAYAPLAFKVFQHFTHGVQH